MDDLDRLFRQLVDALTAKNPERVTAPFQISELYQSILPYRTFKKQLGFECSEDYEMAVLRLFAGEAAYATVEPDEVREQLILEAQAVNPNPGAFREFAAARVKLNETAVRSVQGASRAYAPPPATPAEDLESQAEQWAQFAPPIDEPTEPTLKQPVFEAVDNTPTDETPEPEPTPETFEPEQVESTQLEPSCPNCNENLPANRSVVYCPFCGSRVGPVSCPDCGDELEVGWRFCVACGWSSSDE